MSGGHSAVVELLTAGQEVPGIQEPPDLQLWDHEGDDSLEVVWKPPLNSEAASWLHNVSLVSSSTTTHKALCLCSAIAHVESAEWMRSF